MAKPLITIGRSEEINLPEQGLIAVPARIDTGAHISAIWASDIVEKDSRLECVMFGPGSSYYTGQKIYFTQFSQRVISSSIGVPETRYVVKLLIELNGRKIRASFSLANRSQQTYPVLVGRNALRGKFLVDVKRGQPLTKSERLRNEQLQNKLQAKENI